MIEITNIVTVASNLTANLTATLNASMAASMESATNNYTLLGRLNPAAAAAVTTSATPLQEFVLNATAAAVELTTKWLAAAITQTPTVTTTTEATITNFSIWANSANYSISAAAAAAAATLEPAYLSNLTHFNVTLDEFNACHPENPRFNCTRPEYLKFSLGPQMLPLYKILLVTIIFGGIFITGVLGNVLVCVVIVRHSTMHTATNYYLFSLAVSDLLYLMLGLPPEVFILWHQYPYLFGLPFCKIRAFISEASTYVSVLTIVAFSMERFLAICHPLHLYAMSGFKRAIRIVAALWIVSFISAIPFGWLTGIQYLNYPPDNIEILDSAFCSLVKDFREAGPLFEVSFCIFFVIPMILIIILYGRMGMQIRSRTPKQLGVQQGSMHKESRHQQSRKAVIRMLAAVVVTFFVCWLPFHIQRLWILYAQNHDHFQEINEVLFFIGGFAYYVTCTINPILYNVMSHRYRVAFKDTLCGKRRSVYYKNGFTRDQSSIRETVGSSLGGSSSYDRVQSVRVRSTRNMNNVKDRDSIKANQQALWQQKKKELNLAPQKDIPEEVATLGTNVVVVVENGANSRPKVYTENEAQETLINKNNETCI